jgi:hypothetical protein
MALLALVVVAQLFWRAMVRSMVLVDSKSLHSWMVFLGYPFGHQLTLHRGVYDDPSLGPVLYYHYVDTTVGYADSDKLFGWNAIDFSSGWPVV